MKFCLIILILSQHVCDLQVQLPAFPNARGFGKYTQGGRGGRVLIVENLNDSGPGSFREAAEATGSRYIVFKVGGTIRMKSTLTIEPNVTVAGQTAPGDGILFRDYPLRLAGQGNMIIRGIRSRIGNDGRNNRMGSDGDNTDAFAVEIRNGKNVIIDHCSFSWGTDGSMEMVARPSQDVTFSNCIIGETLLPHALNFLINGAKHKGEGSETRVSIIQNFFLNANGRSPRLGNQVTAEICNNLIYNWRNYPTNITDESIVNVVGNYYKPGPNTDNFGEIRIGNDFNDGPVQLYVSGNIGPSRPTGNEPEDKCIYSYKGGKWRLSTKPVVDSYERTFLNAHEARDYVLAHAGAMPRDAADQRMIQQFKNNTGKIISDEDEVGGFPIMRGGQYPEDSDNDGMPDRWESVHGLDPITKDHNGDKNGDGYTNIENYINSFF